MNVLTKEQFAQHAKAGLPFNPVNGIALAGNNLTRLQHAMKVFNWDDPRFVTSEEARVNGWTVRPNVESVQIVIRDRENGHVENVELFNAQHVTGIPSITKMLAMSDAEIAAIQDTSGLEGKDSDELIIGPAREIGRISPDQVVIPELVPGRQKIRPALRAVGLDGAKTVPPSQKVNEGTPFSGRFAVMAAYWMEGLHNSEGIALAEEINKAIKDAGLETDQEGIGKMLAIYPNAKRLRLKIVPEEIMLDDFHLAANKAEPLSLLDGALVRDKDGAYRPAAGGPAVLVDKGDSLALKSRDKDGYAAAMELAIAKGWTSIELKGKPAMLADAWLEAKMKGLNVVNYAPTKEDSAKYAERMAIEKAALDAADQAKSMEQTPEHVEVRPYVANGLNKVASVTYTVTRENMASSHDAEKMEFDNPRDAAKLFASTPVSQLPAVIRSVTRTDGIVEEDVMVAGIEGAAGNEVKSADAMIDREFSDIFEEMIEAEKEVEVEVDKKLVVESGHFGGEILRYEGKYAVMKVGRDPDKVVLHDMSMLSVKPEIGAIAEIVYDNAGHGLVKGQGLDMERESGRAMSR